MTSASQELGPEPNTFLTVVPNLPEVAEELELGPEGALFNAILAVSARIDDPDSREMVVGWLCTGARVARDVETTDARVVRWAAVSKARELQEAEERRWRNVARRAGRRALAHVGIDWHS